MAKVYNKHHGDAPADAVFIGRPTIWGNPYSHQPNSNAAHNVATRDQAVDAFEHAIKTAPNREVLIEKIRTELKDKDLVCFCAPKRCHGDVLLHIANSEGDPFAELHGLPTPSKIPPMPEVAHRVKPLNQKTLEALPAVIEVVDDNIKYLNDTIAHSANSPTLYARSKDQQQKLIRGKEYLESLLAKKVPHG